MSAGIVIVNPLGGALHHYTRALEDSLAGSLDVRVISVDEPSVAGGSGLAWVARYVRAIVRARAGGSRVIVTWPVLGHLDRVLLRTVLGRRADAVLVMHDPRPLVHARGYGRWSRVLGRLGRRVRLVVHSDAALEVLRREAPSDEPVVLPHPVAVRGRSAASAGSTAGLPMVRVLGQYKPDRDLALLAALGSRLRATHRLEVIGRGWPAIEGWDVRDAFVSEAEMDVLIETADAVLVPYRRFFQSGVAIRSLELGTPAVGPVGSSIADLYPDDRYLASDDVDSWRRAIDTAVTTPRADAEELARLADERARAAWRAEYAVS